MQSVLDSGKKPNCLIIDEIDGAPTVSIFLVFIIKEICYPAQRSDTYYFVFQPAINVLLSVIKKDAAGDKFNYQIH